MTNRPKQIGTAAETAVVRFAQANGFPRADRLTLSGSFDRGDIDLTGDRRVIVEVKAHKSFSDAQVIIWLGDTERERINARADHAFLVVKRPGKGAAQVHHWWAVELETVSPKCAARPVYRYLGDYLTLLRDRGYGEDE